MSTETTTTPVQQKRLVRRWAVQFTATRGEMTGTVKMGAFGDAWEDACQFVRTHCAGQYDSISDIAEIQPNKESSTEKQ